MLSLDHFMTRLSEIELDPAADLRRRRIEELVAEFREQAGAGPEFEEDWHGFLIDARARARATRPKGEHDDFIELVDDVLSQALGSHA